MRLRNLFFVLSAFCLLALGESTDSYAKSSLLQSALTEQPAQIAEKHPVTATIVSNRTAGTPKSNYMIGVMIKHAPGWSTYWKFPGESGYPIEIQWTLPRNWKATPLGWPTPQRHKIGSITTFTYSETVLLPFNLEIPWGTPFDTKFTVRAKVKWLACNDTCVPEEQNLKFTVPIRVSSDPSPENALFEQARLSIPELVQTTRIQAVLEKNRLRLDFPNSMGQIKKTFDFIPFDAQTIDLKGDYQLLSQTDKTSLFLTAHPKLLDDPKTLNGIIVADGGPTKGGWAIQTSLPIIKGNVEPIDKGQFVEKTSEKPIVITNKETQLTHETALLFAFVGGLLLNLMPCVFPVLSLKILHLVDTTRRKGHLCLHGIMFTIGVLLSMLVLVSFLFMLRGFGWSLGWGFQLQNPMIVAFLALLFFAIALNLLGLFEFTAASHLADARALKTLPKTGPLGSFAMGVLTVIVASPCTAPFMGAALGYALMQPQQVAVGIFAMLGIGISLPWLVLTLCPVWVRWLPKPGPWMTKLRRLLSIPMFAACGWLVWVYSRQINFYGIITLAIAAGAFSVLMWLIGREQYSRSSSRVLKYVALCATILCLILIGLKEFDMPHADVDRGWESWSEQSVQTALKEQRPVLVDFTAAWCLTCQYNKAAALHTRLVDRVFNKYRYHRMVADWTNQNADITDTLHRFGRSGVPLYLLYDINGNVTILPEILSEEKLIEALEKNAKKR